MKTYTLEELVEKAGRELAAANITPVDGRSNVAPTVRDVRYYRTLGLLPPSPKLGGGKRYTDKHLQALLDIKKQQSEGVSLKKLSQKKENTSILPSTLATSGASAVMAANSFSTGSSAMLVGNVSQTYSADNFSPGGNLTNIVIDEQTCLVTSKNLNPEQILSIQNDVLKILKGEK